MFSLKKHHSKDNKNLLKRFWPLLAIVGLVGLIVLFGSLNSKVHTYEKLATTPNQACLGVGVALSHGMGTTSFRLEATGKAYFHNEDGKVAEYACKTGLVVNEGTFHGKAVDGYELGANVTYFNSADAAYRYAETKVNPSRYWGIDEEGQRNNIPQTSLFTFLVTDSSEPYFDAYTVRENRLLSISLPCRIVDKMGTIETSFDRCQDESRSILKEFAERSATLAF